jgi:hypothetical protein
MPFCPKCRYEYKLGVTRCSDCDVELVDRLPDPETVSEHRHNTDRSVLLLKTSDRLLAQFVAGALDNADIAYVANHIGPAGRFGGAITGTEFEPFYQTAIYVNTVDLDEAKRIVDSMREEDEE